MKNNAIMLAVIGVLVIAVSAGSFFIGKKVQLAEDDIRIAMAERDTVFKTDTVRLPALPPTRIPGKPVPFAVKDSAEVERLIAKYDSSEARADSLAALVWRLSQPFYGEKETPLGVVHVLSLPLQREVEVAIDTKAMEVQIPEITMKIPVPVPEPWYEDPLYFVSGIVVGAVIVLVAN